MLEWLRLVSVRDIENKLDLQYMAITVLKLLYCVTMKETRFGEYISV